MIASRRAQHPGVLRCTPRRSHEPLPAAGRLPPLIWTPLAGGAATPSTTLPAKWCVSTTGASVWRSEPAPETRGTTARDAQRRPDRPRGRSALHVAAHDGESDGVSELIRAGADIDLRDRMGFTPLHLGAQEYALEAVRRPLGAGAIVDLENEHGNTRLERHRPTTRVLRQPHAPAPQPLRQPPS
jgi:hypothetical protein